MCFVLCFVALGAVSTIVYLAPFITFSPQELVTFQRQRQASFEQAVLKHSENMKWFGEFP